MGFQFRTDKGEEKFRLENFFLTLSIFYYLPTIAFGHRQLASDNWCFAKSFAMI